MKFFHLRVVVAALLGMPTAVLADPSTHELLINPVSTMEKTDCGTGANGQLECVPACIVKYSLRRLGSYTQDDSVTVRMRFTVSERISESGHITFSSVFPLKDELTEGQGFVPATRCRNTKFIDIDATCEGDSSGRPSCKGFTKILLTSRSKKIRPRQKYLSPD